jgi:hypothetical protein
MLLFLIGATILDTELTIEACTSLISVSPLFKILLDLLLFKTNSIANKIAMGRV